MTQLAGTPTPNQQGNVPAVDADVEQQVNDSTDVPAEGENQSRHRKQRILRWPRRTRSNDNVIPMGALKIRDSDSTEAAALRTQAIELLFGLSAEFASEWPGIIAFCRHLESCFEELLQPQFEIIWKIVRRNNPSNTVDCWHWCFAVVKSFQALRDDASIENVYKRMIGDAKVPDHEVKSHERKQILRAMFAVLCWMSATLEPVFDDEVIRASRDEIDSNDIFLAATNASRIYSTKYLRRPISKMFYAFQENADEAETSENQPTTSGTESSIGRINDVLYQSSLDYFALFTIGRVQIKWVNTLTEHLAFNRSTRQLSIFRFPSFCATNVLRTNDVHVLRNITGKLLPSHYYTDSPRDPSLLHREVLLSYRLLFGQSSKARKLISQLLSQEGSIEMDPFLNIICTLPLVSSHYGLPFSYMQRRSQKLPSNIFPSSVLDINEKLQQCDTYSVRNDFSVFGVRLLMLQDYNMRQQPSRVKDLWRDRRNPLQWYTFWAVLFVGGASILLAVLQLLVGIAQLYLAANPV